MTNTNLQNLPPEMQARLADILKQANANVPAAGTNSPMPTDVQNIPAAPRTPSLMDHTLALRQEVNQLSQQVYATGQVVATLSNANRNYRLQHKLSNATGCRW
jgi:hypothetical protein